MHDANAPEPGRPSPSRRKPEPSVRSPWPIVASVLGIVAILAAGAVFVAHRALSVPGEVAREGQKAVAELRSLAAAFRQGTITTTFARESTSLAGTTRLQLATLRQSEVFTRRDAQSIFWGQVPLPDVVVEARAPVEYTYYLDLEKPWTLRLEGDVLRVVAPPIEWNAPAIDASALRYQVREDSVFRDETAVVKALQESLTGATRARARENVSLVRETARTKAGEFVRTFLTSRFDDAKEFRVEVAFADEKVKPPEMRPSAPEVTKDR